MFVLERADAVGFTSGMAFPVTNPALQRALAAQGYAEPTPVQTAVLEQGGGERDLLVSAQTGSGKTVAYGLAMATALLGDAEAFEAAGAPVALVVAPTRELALQVHGELAWLYADTGAWLVTCVGGMDPRKEQRALAAGADIVVGTPGRLKDHLERGNLDSSGLRIVILDEADEMLDLGFREDLEFLLDASPRERRTLLFSATIAKNIAALAKRYQRDAVRIDTVGRDEPHGDIEYRAMRVAPNEVENAVVNVLRFFEARGALVFCATREAVRHLHGALVERGFAAVALSGELSQSERTHALQALRDGRARVCVATDVAARGLDLPDLGLFIHAELPVNRAVLLHRSGRTGRAGRKGVSVLLAPVNRQRRAEQLIHAAGVEAHWSGPPSAASIRERDAQRLLEHPVLTADGSPEDPDLTAALLQKHGAEALVGALVRLYRQALPEPEELYDPGPKGGDFGKRKDAPRGRERGERGEVGERPERRPRAEPVGTDGAVWFRLNVGREKNADPKWLIPLICRLGHVTKPDIGLIRIFDRETKFEILPQAAERFAEAVGGAAEGGLRISPAAGPPTAAAGGKPRRGPPPKGKGRPQGPPPAKRKGGYGSREG